MTISGKAKLAGVMGWPVSHSRSPLLHNHWISIMGLEAVYVPLAVSPDNFETALKALPTLGFRGANVTVPHKEAAFHLCKRHDKAALRVRAVNTIVCLEDGTLEGRNTDVVGFSESLKLQAGLEGIEGATAVVLGAGGAARAVVAALVDLNCACIRICNRTVEKAQAIANSLHDEDVEIHALGWDERDDALDGATILVNTTTLGMVGQPALAIDLAPLPRGSIVADIVYTPLETPLLAAARELGLTAVGGLRMLIEQARPGFEAWFGEKPPVTRDLIEMLETDVKAKAG